VVWAVAVGSLKNKVILIPAALAISAFAPWGVAPLLMIGGLYLCYEGVEKLVHKWLHSQAEDDAHHAEQLALLADENIDLAAAEADKIKGAIRTDFVLSAEIIVIALGTVATQDFASQVTVLSVIGVVMTIGVYGFVAGIVKMDDVGLHLLENGNALSRTIGRGLLLAAPLLMKTLAVVGTIAMFMVGGGILSHGIPVLHHGIAEVAEAAETIAVIGGVLKAITPTLLDAIVGIIGGVLALVAVKGVTASAGVLKRGN
jgi:predicted DNA repair protein MutK